MDLRISYNGNVVGVYPWGDWEKITIPCKNNKMVGDIVIEELLSTSASQTSTASEVIEEYSSGVSTFALPGGGTSSFSVQIVANDGVEILYTKLGITSAYYEVFENGIRDKNGGIVWSWTYSGDENFLGFARTANATTPTLVNGNTGTLTSGANTFYLVTSPAYKSIKITYGGSELATLSGAKLTVKCGGNVMKGNIVIEKI